MSNFMILSVVSLSLMIFATKNPVKMSMVAMISACLIFFCLFLSAGKSWFPLLLTLLFTGGILIMFMILSSFHPNETTSKIKTNWVTISLILMLSMYTPQAMHMQSHQNYYSSIKMMYQNLSTSTMLTLIIVLYFSIFLKVMSKEKNTMRILLC